MSVAVSIEAGRLPGCGPTCIARSHDPVRHELYGLLMATLTPPTRTVRTGPLVIRRDDRLVSVGGVDVVLPDREWDVLVHLADNLGRWCDGEAIVRAVWGPDYQARLVVLRKNGPHRTDTGLLNTTRNRLRQRLGAAGALIESRRHADKPASMRLLNVSVTP